MTQEKLPHRKELCLQSEALDSSGALFLGNLFIHSRLIYSEAGDKKEVVPWQP